MLLELVSFSCRHSSGLVMGLASDVDDGRRDDEYDAIEETSV